MLPSTSSREALLAYPSFPPWNMSLFIVESTLTSPCSRSDPPLSHQGVALPPYDLVLQTNGSVPFPFGKGGFAVLAICSLGGTEATLFFLAGPVCSSFSAEACAILHALSAISLLLSDSYSVLSSIFPLISNSVSDLAGIVFSLLLLYQTTIGPWTLVSPRKQHG